LDGGSNEAAGTGHESLKIFTLAATRGDACARIALGHVFRGNVSAAWRRVTLVRAWAAATGLTRLRARTRRRSSQRHRCIAWPALHCTGGGGASAL